MGRVRFPHPTPTFTIEQTMAIKYKSLNNHNDKLVKENSMDISQANIELMEIYNINKFSYPRCDGSRIYFDTKELLKSFRNKFN